MKHALMLALLAGTLPASLSESQARVTLSERTISYTVGGRTGKEIYAQIGRRGPLLTGQRDHKVATTTFSFDVRNIQGTVRGNRCVVTRVDVHVTAVYRVPKWTGRGSPAVRRAWDNFLAHIWRHEKRHTEIAMEYANRLETGLRGITGDARRECAGLAEAGDQLAKRSRAWHDRRQQAFDLSWFGDGGQQFKFDKALIAAE